jgi:hypothetical protein
MNQISWYQGSDFAASMGGLPLLLKSLLELKALS